MHIGRAGAKLKLEPKSARTLSNYINELIDLGYLAVERAKRGGNIRSFRID